MVAANIPTPIKEFQCNRAFEFGVFGLVNDTHPTFPEFLEDLVVRDGLTDQKHTPSHPAGFEIATYGIATGCRQRWKLDALCADRFEPVS